MILNKLRYTERWERLKDINNAKWAFIWFSIVGVLWYCAMTRPEMNFYICDSRFVSSPYLCRRSTLAVVQFAVGLFGVNAIIVLIRLITEFCRPLQARPFSPLLKTLLVLERLRVEKVFKSDQLELTFTTLTKNFQPYQPYVLTVTGLQRCNFYQEGSRELLRTFHFRGETILEFSRIEPRSHLDYSRVRFTCIHQGQRYSGELELEADSYTLQPLPRSRR